MAEKETDDDTSKEEKEKTKKPSSGNMLQMIILVLLLLVLGLGGFIAWKLVNMEVPLLPGQEQASSQPPEKAERNPGILIDLDNITVNLADTDDSRFLRVKIKLGVETEEDKIKVESFQTQTKDLIITLLSSKSFSDVRTAQGKFALKEELAYRINSMVGERMVKNVYFSDFVAQ